MVGGAKSLCCVNLYGIARFLRDGPVVAAVDDKPSRPYGAQSGLRFRNPEFRRRSGGFISVAA